MLKWRFHVKIFTQHIFLPALGQFENFMKSSNKVMQLDVIPKVYINILFHE